MSHRNPLSNLASYVARWLAATITLIVPSASAHSPRSTLRYKLDPIAFSTTHQEKPRAKRSAEPKQWPTKSIMVANQSRIRGDKLDHTPLEYQTPCDCVVHAGDYGHQSSLDILLVMPGANIQQYWTGRCTAQYQYPGPMSDVVVTKCSEKYVELNLLHRAR